MNEVLANSNVLQLTLAACCIILSIGIAVAMIVGARGGNTTRNGQDDA